MVPLRFCQKEVIQLKRQREKLQKFLGGIKDMKGVPGAIFVIDTKKNSTYRRS